MGVFARGTEMYTAVRLRRRRFFVTRFMCAFAYAVSLFTVRTQFLFSRKQSAA